MPFINFVFKSIKYLFLTSIVVFILFALARTLFCGPDKNVEKVAFPLAKAIMEHLEVKGMPGTLNEVDDLPYDFIRCSRSTKNNMEKDFKTKREYLYSVLGFESCTFMDDKDLYKVQFNTVTGVVFDDVYVDIDITHKYTRVDYRVRYIGKEKRWEYESYPQARVFSMQSGGVCKTQPLRITQ